MFKRLIKWFKNEAPFHTVLKNNLPIRDRSLDLALAICSDQHTVGSTMRVAENGRTYTGIVYGYRIEDNNINILLRSGDKRFKKAWTTSRRIS